MKNNNEKCDNIKLNKEVINKKHKKIPTDEKIYDLAELFKLFGDSTRIKIIYAIYKRCLCVHEIASIINMTQSSVSHQLKNLKQARLVKSKKEGKEVYYTLDDEHIEKIFKLGLEHIEEV